jgi:hypothetical protein
MGAKMKQQMARRLGIGAVLVSLLAGCSSSASTTADGSVPVSDVSSTEASTTTFEITTTTAPLAVEPACDLSAVSADQDVSGLIKLECLGDWMITQSYPDCGECEGVIPFHLENNEWKMYDPLYIYCYSVPDGYGPEPEGAITNESFIFTTIQIAVAGFPCDETNKGYHPESATDQLLYGDIGPRVTALQEALVSTGFLEDVADGQYGPATIKAVMNFQFSQNIPVDGIAGPNTHALLGIAYP